MVAMEDTIIYGETIDADGRCVHWHSMRDIIANKCATCQKFYACHMCHLAKENHEFGRFSASTENKIVMCGVCGHQFTYGRYENISACDNCQAPFNPGCSLHKHLYVND